MCYFVAGARRSTFSLFVPHASSSFTDSSFFFPVASFRKLDYHASRGGKSVSLYSMLDVGETFVWWLSPVGSWRKSVEI